MVAMCVTASVCVCLQLRVTHQCQHVRREKWDECHNCWVSIGTGGYDYVTKDIESCEELKSFLKAADPDDFPPRPFWVCQEFVKKSLSGCTYPCYFGGARNLGPVALALCFASIAVPLLALCVWLYGAHVHCVRSDAVREALRSSLQRVPVVVKDVWDGASRDDPELRYGLLAEESARPADGESDRKDGDAEQAHGVCTKGLLQLAAVASAKV